MMVTGQVVEARQHRRETTWTGGEAKRRGAGALLFASRGMKPTEGQGAGEKDGGQPLLAGRHLRPVFFSTAPTLENAFECLLQLFKKTTSIPKGLVDLRAIYSELLYPCLQAGLHPSLGCGELVRPQSCSSSLGLIKVGLENGESCYTSEFVITV